MICVDNVFLLFVCLFFSFCNFNAAIVVSNDWDVGECDARAVHYLGDRGGLLCLPSFFLFFSPPTPLS